ncbi:MAG: hypothetical protein JSR98_00445 [Proteobacteria bacterium]|nr:hypothetical protein [Pseudomonadota bacterium]
MAQVRAAIDRGEAWFWSAPGSALVAVVEADPADLRLLIWLAGGDRRELEEMLLPQAEAWARERGCRRVLVIGREGWARTLRPKGYAPLARIIAKDL